MPDAAIRWPKGPDFQKFNDLITACHPRLTGAFASIDGLNLPVQTSADQDIENATYNGWLSEHFISSVLVFSPHGGLFFHTNIPLFFEQSSRENNHPPPPPPYTAELPTNFDESLPSYERAINRHL